MSLNFEFTTVLSILLISGAVAYPLSFLHNRKIGYISLIQVFYLVLLPGILYTLVFNEMFDILARPLNETTFLNDKILTVLLMVSLLYTYGGVAIHSLSKTLSRYFTPKEKLNSEVYEVNEAFHLSFSHNLIYSGVVLSGTFFALLELNHVSPYGPEKGATIAVLNGIFVGMAAIAALNFFVGKSKPWRTLKFFFATLWLALVLIVYAAKPYFSQLDQYPWMLTLLVALAILFSLNVFLYIKRVRGKFKLLFRLPRQILSKL